MTTRPTNHCDSADVGFFVAFDNSDPQQLWVWRGQYGDESAEPWQPVTGFQSRVEVLESELTAAAELLQQALPIGEYRGIGLREVAAAIEHLIRERDEREEAARWLRDWVRKSQWTHFDREDLEHLQKYPWLEADDA